MKRSFLLVLFVLCLGLAACGGTTVGRTCTATADCDTAQTCYTAAPGGFCSKGCFAEGSTRDCPGGSVCAASLGALLCSPVCQTQADCREEYECNGVTGSDQKVCRLKTK